MPYFELDPLLNKMLDFAPGISDLNLSVGRPPQVELDGQLKAVDYMGVDKLSPYQTEQIAMRLIAGTRDVADTLVNSVLKRDVDIAGEGFKPSDAHGANDIVGIGEGGSSVGGS